MKNSLEIHSERDECTRIFNGFTSTFRIICCHFELLITIVYCSFSIYLLYCLGQPHSSREQEQVIIDTNLIAAFAYLILTMRQNGQAFLDVIFRQFEVEMLNQTIVAKRLRIKKQLED